MIGTVFDIQRFCTHDGPGIRTTVFLKGCPLRCVWCHNPESQKAGRQILFSPNICIDCKGCERVCPKGNAREILADVSRVDCSDCFACADACPTGAIKTVGREMTVEEVLDEVLKDVDFYESGKGGMTVSGGEPFSQCEFTAALIRQAKQRGLNICIETCGWAVRSELEKLLPFVDLWLWDVKDTDETRHSVNTGASLKTIIENLEFVDASGGATALRCVLAGGVNTDITHYSNLAKLYDRLANCRGIELLRCHSLGNSKLQQLGRQDLRPDFTPTSAQLELACEILGDRVVAIR